MEFYMVLLVFPTLSFAFGAVGQLLTGRIYIPAGITFTGWLIATYTVFNDSFLIWVFAYTALSLLGAGMVWLIKKAENKK